MRNIVEETFSVHLFCLRIFGYLPFENYKNCFRVSSIIVYLSLTVLLPLLFIIWLVNENSIDVSKLSNSAFVAFELGVFIWKYLPCVIHGPEIIETIYMLNKPIFRSNIKPRQQIIFNNYLKIFKRISKIFYFMVCIGLILISSVPVLTSPGTLPIEIWRPAKNKTSYIIAYGYVVIGMVHGALMSVSYDMLVAGLIYQGSCQVEILRDNLKNLNEDVEQELDLYLNKTNLNFKATERQYLKNKMAYKKIKCNIFHHQNIISFINRVQYYFSSGVLSQFLGSCIVICLSIFELTVVQPFSSFFIFICNYIMDLLIQIFVYCIFGTTLYEESNNICTSIYMGNWLELDLKSQKALMLLMERANKPMIVTAGSVLNLSLNTFVMILRRAYSFYAVLRRYQ